MELDGYVAKFLAAKFEGRMYPPSLLNLSDKVVIFHEILAVWEAVVCFTWPDNGHACFFP